MGGVKWVRSFSKNGGMYFFAFSGLKSAFKFVQNSSLCTEDFSRRWIELGRSGHVGDQPFQLVGLDRIQPGPNFFFNEDCVWLCRYGQSICVLV
jgi:hypothetical protein